MMLRIDGLDSRVRESLEIDFNPSLNVIRAELDQVRDYMSESIRVSDIPIESYTDLLFEETDGFPGPALVILSGRVTGGFRSEHIPVAAMIEMMYRSSLLHNQIDSATRDADPTGSILPDATAASILLGDFLLSRVFAIQARLQMKEVADVLGRTAVTLITAGLQRKLKGNGWKISEKDYMHMASRQNPALFRSACQLGALLAGASDSHLGAMSEYGYQLGMAHQIKDDLQTVLKAQQNNADDMTVEDLLNKKTLPVVHCLNQGGQSRIDEKMELESLFPLLHQTNSINYTRKCIRQFADRAARLLSSFSPSPYTESLSAMVDSIHSFVSAEDVSA